MTRYSNPFRHLFANLVLFSLICGVGWSPLFAQVADEKAVEVDDEKAAAVEDAQTPEESAEEDAEEGTDSAVDASAKAAPVKMSEAEVKAKVAELLKLLQSRDEAERDKAEAQLVELGSAALGQLPTVTVDTAEEMRARLNRCLLYTSPSPRDS